MRKSAFDDAANGENQSPQQQTVNRPKKEPRSRRHSALRRLRRARNELNGASMLTHFTRASAGGSALDNLVAILREGRVRGGKRMVRGSGRVVSLFDAPLGELSRLLARKNRRRYQPFGIALDKRYAFKRGARPVIYMPWREARRILPAEEMWRVVSIDLDRTPIVDWTFEREWRVVGDLDLPGEGSVALVETWRDAEEIYRLFAGNPPLAGVMPLLDLFGAN